MKNYLIVFAFLHCILMHSQTQKGRWLFENTFGNFSSNDATWEQLHQGTLYTFDDKITQLNIDLNTGFFAHKKLVIGVGLYSNYSQVTSIGYYNGGNKIAEGNSKACLLIGAPFVRYYLNPDAKSSLYVQIGGGGGGYIFNTSKSTQYYETGTVYTKFEHQYSDHRVLTLQSFVGINHFFNEYVAFNTGVGFNYTKVEYTDLVSYNYPIVNNPGTQSFMLKSKQKILLWRFGFSIFLGKKKEVKKEKLA